MNVDDVLTVARAYAGRDTWGVENIYLPTLAHLLRALDNGIPVALIATHAQHVGRHCCVLFDEVIPTKADIEGFR